MIEHLLLGRHLTEVQAANLLATLTSPEAPEAEKAGLLVALRAKGEQPDELRGMARALRDAAVPLDLGDVVDTCGTGGDGKHTINLSTAAALVVAAAGHRTAKHGNRSVSSRCGSADVVQALGIPLPASPDDAHAQIAATGFTFLFAPQFHPAMHAVAPVRRHMGIRTAFNLLGPLANPARPRRQLIGAYSEPAAALIAQALVGLVDRATVVFGHGGYDEATPLGPFVAYEVRGTHVVRRVRDPRDEFGVARCRPADLAGGDAPHNASILTKVFAGGHGPVHDAICLNAALVLELTGDPAPYDTARTTLASGAVGRLVEALRV